MELTTFKVMVSVVLIGVFSLVLRLYRAVILEPKRLRSVLKRQGIDGPPPTFLLGNAKDIKKPQSTTQQSSVSSLSHYLFAPLFPSFQEWRAKYGQIFMFALGNTQILFVNEPDAVKEINKCTSLELGKPTYQQKLRSSLLGQGIISSNGKVWAHQRKILAPEFYMNKVQGMINLITKSTITLLDSWKNRTFKEGGVVDIKIDEDMRIFSRDVISRACFGSNFDKGQEIFNKLRALEDVMSRKSLAIGIPGLRYLPTKNKREEQALKKEVRNLILQVVKQRIMEVGYEKDLLQMLLGSAKNSNFNEEVANSFIVDNCKNIYLAGSQTTAVSATWCLMLLAANQEWQERVRAEVFKICGAQMPDADMLRQMKQLTMVIQETLRLYPVIPVVSREVFKDMKFGEICVPKGVNIWIMMLTLHTDPETWGPDAHEFKPQRFTNGISGACRLPHLYMPFGVGPRVCLGQNLAMVELKILVALILTKFSISLSPNYVHKPVMRLIIEPEHGVDLLVKDL